VTTAPRPGWYPDPAGSDELFRWWDGREWTDSVSDSGHDWPPAAPTPATSQPWATAPTPVAGAATSTVRRWLLLTCGFTVFVVAGMGVGLMIWRDPDLSTAADRSGPSASDQAIAGPPSAPVGRLDKATGIATLGRASLTLPGAPFKPQDDPIQVDGVFDALFVADAEVHEDYDGRHSWSAAVGLAHLSPELTSSANLDQVGSRALHQLSRKFFGGHPTSLRHVSSAEHSVDGHPGALFTAEVHYAVPRLPSRYDHVSALVVRLDDGSLVIAASSVPNDAEPELVSLAATSLRSLTIS
jgi:hypothetical protein